MSHGQAAESHTKPIRGRQGGLIVPIHLPTKHLVCRCFVSASSVSNITDSLDLSGQAVIKKPGGLVCSRPGLTATRSP